MSYFSRLIQHTGITFPSSGQPEPAVLGEASEAVQALEVEEVREVEPLGETGTLEVPRPADDISQVEQTPVPASQLGPSAVRLEPSALSPEPPFTKPPLGVAELAHKPVSGWDHLAQDTAGDRADLPVVEIEVTELPKSYSEHPASEPPSAEVNVAEAVSDVSVVQMSSPTHEAETGENSLRERRGLRYLKEVREWVAATPAPDEKARDYTPVPTQELLVEQADSSQRRDALPLAFVSAPPATAEPEIQNFSLSIGAIQLTIEETQQPPTFPNPPPSTEQRPASSMSVTSRLRRHYLRF